MLIGDLVGRPEDKPLVRLVGHVTLVLDDPYCANDKQQEQRDLPIEPFLLFVVHSCIGIGYFIVLTVLNIDNYIEGASQTGVAVDTVTGNVPGLSDVAVVMEQTALITDTPSQMQGTEYLGIDADNQFEPVL